MNNLSLAALASVDAYGVPWGWILTVAVGGFIGLAMYMSTQDLLDYTGTSAGCLGTIVAGVFGAVLGELVLDQLFDVRINDFIWALFTAIIGASLMVMLVSRIRGRRQSTRSGDRF